MNGGLDVVLKGKLIRRVLTALLLGIALLLVTPSVSLAADCQFVLGFKTLRDLVGHDIVGDCLEGEHYNAIGDSVQQTTGGLLAWRKADNWTAFTDGYRTWVNGPDGLQQRLNTERFEWEADYAEISGKAAIPALTRDALRNAEYQHYGETVRLKDGFLARKLQIGQESWQLHDSIAFGDLDGDGDEDAAVVLSYSGGGSGTFYNLLAIRNDNGAPVHVASFGIGDRIRLNGLAIAAGVITVRMVAHGPTDGLCCPTQDTEATFRLNGNALELLSEAPPGNLTASAQRATRPAVDPSRIDSSLVEAFQELRNAHSEKTAQLYNWFVASGARAQFGSLEGTSQFDSSSNLITINEEYRNESPEALAHTLIWPLVSLHAIGVRGGPPQSWDQCIADRQAAHSAQASWWLATFGWNGKQYPTELEQWANDNLASHLDKSLEEWVREAYRESCAYYGDPPPLPIQTPVPYPSVDKYIRHAGDLVGAIYLAYLDSLGAYASDDTRDFNDFYGQYLGNSTFRRSVGNAVREHLQSVEYLGPNLTAVLRSERFSLDHRVHVIGNVEKAVIRATVTKWLADILVASKPRDIELELWSVFKGKTVEWLNSNPIPNPWLQYES